MTAPLTRRTRYKPQRYLNNASIPNEALLHRPATDYSPARPNTGALIAIGKAEISATYSALQQNLTYPENVNPPAEKSGELIAAAEDSIGTDPKAGLGKAPSTKWI